MNSHGGKGAASHPGNSLERGEVVEERAVGAEGRVRPSTGRRGLSVDVRVPPSSGALLQVRRRSRPWEAATAHGARDGAR